MGPQGKGVRFEMRPKDGTKEEAGEGRKGNEPGVEVVMKN